MRRKLACWISWGLYTLQKTIRNAGELRSRGMRVGCCALGGAGAFRVTFTCVPAYPFGHPLGAVRCLAARQGLQTGGCRVQQQRLPGSRRQVCSIPYEWGGKKSSSGDNGQHRAVW